MLLKTQTGNRLFLELHKDNFFSIEAFPSLSRQSRVTLSCVPIACFAMLEYEHLSWFVDKL